MATDRHVTFVLPGDNRSGGVRVTAMMGNLLLERGYRVRIVHRAPPAGSVAALRGKLESIRNFVLRRHAGWL
jgi:hypothetical protein